VEHLSVFDYLQFVRFDGVSLPLRDLTLCVDLDWARDYGDDDESLCGSRVPSYAIVFVAIDGKCFKKGKPNCLPGTRNYQLMGGSLQFPWQIPFKVPRKPHQKNDIVAEKGH